MSAPQHSIHTSLQELGKRIAKLILWLLIITVLVFFVGCPLLRPTKPPQVSSPAPTTPQAQPARVKGILPTPAEDDLARAEAEFQEKRAEAVASYLDLQGKAELSKRYLTDAIALEKQTTKFLSDLLFGDDGRFIAANKDLVMNYEAITGLALPIEELAALADKATEFSSTMKGLKESPKQTKLPANTIRSSCVELQKEAMSWHSRADIRAKKATALLETAKGRKAAGAKNLKDALREVQSERASQTLEEDTKAFNEARKKTAELIRVAEVEAILKAGKTKADQTALEAKLTAERLQLEMELSKKKADRAARKKKALSPEVQAALAPLTTKGYKQLKDRHDGGVWVHVHWVATSEKAPVSLAGLKGVGALDENLKGLTTLHQVFMSSWNDRVKGGKEPHFWHLNETPVESTKKLQRLLIELDDVLVEEGMLLP